MKVFVSSTVYDLLDVRAEVAATLASMGISPVLSDDATSGFDTAHATNSIETCLINVENCDEVIVILDKRYGPRLGKLGFPNVSATHLEYKKARELGKPIHFFVRDRLEADYFIWKKNRMRPELKLSWVDAEDLGVFDFLEEHRSLTSNAIKNWIIAFTTVVDLKKAMQRTLEPRIKPARLVEMLARNQFPLICVNHKVNAPTKDYSGNISVAIRATNMGSATAFNYVCVFGNDAPCVTDVVMPGQTIERIIFVRVNIPNPFIGQMRLEYDSAIGVRVRESYNLQWHGSSQGMLMGGVSLLTRTYHNAPEIRLAITDP